MKKEYLKPICECVAFKVKETLMGDGTDIGTGPSGFDEDVEDW